MQELTLIQQQLLACVGDHPAQFTRSGIAKLLVGSESVRLDIDRGDVWYGRFQGQTRKSLTFVVDTLLQQGYLSTTWEGKLMVVNQRHDAR